MKGFLVIIVLMALYHCQEDEQPQAKLDDPNPNMQIKEKEIQKKLDSRLDRTVFEQLNVLVTKNYTEFFVIPEVEEEIRGTFDVFWKQKNVYLMANVQNKEDIQVVVTDSARNILFKDSFYTASGFKFQGVARQVYKIRMTNKGQIQKLLIMKISQKVKAPQNAAKKTEMMLAQDKLFYSLTKLQNALSQTKTGHIIDQQIASYVYHQSMAYSHFQIFESLMVVGISCLQVMFVTRLLKSDIVI